MSKATTKPWLTYNQQLNKLRKDKRISCGAKNGSPEDKSILVRNGYFNLINGYKEPMLKTKSKPHQYLDNISVAHFFNLKQFDESLRNILLVHCTQVEEELKTITAHLYEKYKSINSQLKDYTWSDISTYKNTLSVGARVDVLALVFSDISKSKSKYKMHYSQNHDTLPSWIVYKLINFNTFIELLKIQDNSILNALCKLYNLPIDKKGFYNHKFLINMLHSLRRVRNSCAHNERIFTFNGSDYNHNKHNTRSKIIFEHFFINNSEYILDSDMKLIDIIAYLKFFLPPNEYSTMIAMILQILAILNLKLENTEIVKNVLQEHIGIKSLHDLENLSKHNKKDILYHKVESFIK